MSTSPAPAPVPVVVTLPAGTETGLGTLTPAIGESSLVCIDRTAPGGLKSVTSAVTRPDAGKTSVAPAGSGVSAVTRPDAGRGRCPEPPRRR